MKGIYQSIFNVFMVPATNSRINYAPRMIQIVIWVVQVVKAKNYTTMMTEPQEKRSDQVRWKESLTLFWTSKFELGILRHSVQRISARVIFAAMQEFTLNFEAKLFTGIATWFLIDNLNFYER